MCYQPVEWGRNDFQLRRPALHEALVSGTQAAAGLCRTVTLRCEPANNDKAEGWPLGVPLPPYVHEAGRQCFSVRVCAQRLWNMSEPSVAFKYSQVIDADGFWMRQE